MKKKITCLTIALALVLSSGIVAQAALGEGPRNQNPRSAPPPICAFVQE